SQQIDPSPPAYSIDPVVNMEDPGMDYLQKGDQCCDNGDFKEAAEHYNQAIKFRPEEANERLKIIPKDIGLFSELTTRLEARTLQLKKSIAMTSNKSSRGLTLKGPYFPKRVLSLRSALESEKSPVSQIFGSMDHAVGEPLTTISLVTSFAKAESTSNSDILNLIKSVIMQFGKNFISLDTVQELVILATIPDKEIFLGIANQMLKALQDSHILSCVVLQGLAVILSSCPEKIDLSDEHGVFLEILKPITVRLSAMPQDKNKNQLIPLLQAISALFDAMICRKVVGVDHDNIYVPLRRHLHSLSSHEDPTVSFLAEYASQGLEFIGNNEPVQMTIFRYGKLAFALAKDVREIAINMDLSAFESAYDNLTNLCDFPKKHVWFQGLIYLNCVMGLKDWSQFETFVFKSKLKSNEKFLQGVCLYLERIVVTQENEDVCSGATRFLYALKSKSGKQVQKVAQDALQRLGIQTETGTSMKGAISFLASRFISSIIPAGSEDNIPPVWDPLWYSNPSNVLLKVVQAREQRNANILKLPLQIENFKSEMKADNAELKADMDTRFNQIQTDLTLVKDINIIASSTPEEIRDALQKHYEGLLNIQQVSGDKKDLKDCFINLAVVAAQEQRQKDKEELEANHATGYQEPEKSNALDSTPIEELFNKRMLRDGREDIPKTILIHGRPGIGKTTLCKKLVDMYQRNKVWQERFAAVLWLPLRQLRNIKPENLEDLLRKKYFSKFGDKEKKELVHSMASLAREGKVLFVLDGLDEVMKDTRLQEGSSFDVFIRDLLQHKHVVITTRPSGVDKSILPKLDLELEAVGFSADNVMDYISMAFKPNPESVNAVYSFIKRTPIVQGLVNIPVQLDAICYSWDDLPSGGESVTMTMLYKTMVWKLFSKDIARLGKSDGLSKLSERQIKKLLESEIECLEYLAFAGMMNDHQIEFNDKAIRKIVDELDEHRENAGLQTLPVGLVDNLKQMSFLHTADADLVPGKDDSKQSWYFLHLTFQEYFAAEWLARHLQSKQKLSTKNSVFSMTPEQTTKFVQTHKYNPQYEIVWRMVAGLLEGSALELFFDLLQRPPRDIIGARHRLLLAGCYLESRTSLSDNSLKWIERELKQWLRFKMKLTGGTFIESSFDWQIVISEEVSGRSLGRAIIKKLNELTEPTVLQKVDGVWKRTVQILTTRRAKVDHVGPTCGKSSYTYYEDGFDQMILLKELESEDLSVRISAAKSLSLDSNLWESTITALTSALQDDSSDLRRLVAKALGCQISLPEYAIMALVALFQDKNLDVRRSAVEAFHQQSLLPEYAIEALLTLLQDDDSEVRKLAVEALGQISPIPERAIVAIVSSLRDDNTEVRKSAVEVLGRNSPLPEYVIAALVTSLQDGDSEVRRSAVEVLGQSSPLPEYAIVAIVSSLKDVNAKVRKSAVEVLGQNSPLPEYAIVAIVSLLKDVNAEVRKSAVEVLGQNSPLPEYAILALISSFLDEDSEVRELAAGVISMQLSLSETAIEALVTTLKSEYSDSRISVVNILDQQSSLPEYAITALITSFQDEDSNVRRLAAEIISKQLTLSETAIEALVTTLKSEYSDSRISVVNILDQQSPLPEYAITALITSFQDEDSNVRRLAAEVISKQSTLSETAIAALITTLKSEYSNSRISVVKILGQQPSLSECTILAIIASLQDEDSEVRKLAAKIIGVQSVLSESAMSALVTALQCKYPDSRRYALEMLGRQSSLPENTISAFVVSLQDDDPVVRKAAADALGHQSILPEFATAAIIPLLQDESLDVKSSAVQIVVRQPTLSEPIIIALGSLLQDMDTFHRKLIVEAFDRQSMLPEPAITVLEVTLHDTSQWIRHLSAYILGRQPTLSELAIASLVANLQNDDQYDRWAAGSALGGLK
ncbi:hypothetical protein BGX27_001868, partial [Mortierella sp. AM989]